MLQATGCDIAEGVYRKCECLESKGEQNNEEEISKIISNDQVGEGREIKQLHIYHIHIYICSIIYTYAYMHIYIVKDHDANELTGRDQHAIAKPVHSTISPKKLAPDTNSNAPPVQEHRTDEGYSQQQHTCT